MDFKENLKVKNVETIPEHISNFIKKNEDNLITIYNGEREKLENKYGILLISIDKEENKVDVSYITKDVNYTTNLIEEHMWNDSEVNKKQIILVKDKTYGDFFIDLNQKLE
tara:strand:- start:8067 stop:8399 length:333 start_codon:yes stop_codon:yes gene_type:complete